MHAPVRSHAFPTREALFLYLYHSIRNLRHSRVCGNPREKISLDNMLANTLQDVAVRRTFSTDQAASKAGIHPVTLRRWLSQKKVRPSIAVPYDGRTLWRWTDV